MFRFRCEGQELRCVAYDEAASGYLDTVFAEFKLCERWAGMVVTAQYTQMQNGGSKTYNELVDRETNLAKVSNSLIDGPVDVSIFGEIPGTGERLTTVPVRIRIRKSGFTSTAETPIPPTPDLYAQLLKEIEKAKAEGVPDEQIEKAVAAYLEENPIDTGVKFETDATLKLEDGVLSVNTADSVEKDNTLPVTSAAVYTEVGNINALLATI